MKDGEGDPALGRFLLLWAGVAAAACLAETGLNAAVHRLFWIEIYSPSWWAFFLIREPAIGLLWALAQSHVLKRCGRPVPGWTLALGVGHVVLALASVGVGYLWTTRTVALVAPATAQAWSLAFGLGYAFFHALALAVLIGAVVWGRGWPASWPIWVFGLILVEMASVGFRYALMALPSSLFRDVRGLPLSLMMCLLFGVWMGGGTGWLLWRRVLPWR